MSEERKIHDKYGIERSVNFIQIMKIDDGKLKMSRLFFKDFDGSIIEVPQKKIFVRTRELKHIKRQNAQGAVNVYNDEIPLATLCRNTQDYIKGNRAANLLKNEEDGIGLDKGEASVILEEENEESPDKQPAIQQTKTFLRLTTVGKGKKNRLIEEDEGALIEMQDLNL